MKKKLLIVMSLISLSVTAQSFPDPYCDVTEYLVVEEITEISLNGVTITNSDDTLPLIDNTATVINLEVGQEYTITVKGYTGGEYFCRFIMYIDWDQNGILNDDGEDYVIGTIFDSDGTDDVSASFTFTVPSTATLGQTRIRVNKGYEEEEWDIYMVNDPCSITNEEIYDGESYVFDGFGQMLDFTLNITDEALAVPSLDLVDLKLYPNPANDWLTIEYKDEIHQVEIFDISGKSIATYYIGETTKEIPVNYLSSGTYLIEIKTKEGEISTVKFVKK